MANMKLFLKITLFMLILVAVPGAAGQAQGTPRRAPVQVGLTQSATVCQQVLADPEVSAAQVVTPWRSYAAGWNFSTTQFRSTPQALALSSSGAAVGQTITITANLAELYGTLSYFYTSGSTAPSDELQVALYEVGKIAPSGLIATVAVLTGTGRLEGSWQTLEWAVFDPATLNRLVVLGQAALVFSAVSGASPDAQRLWLDDLQANVCVPSPSISGSVTQGATELAEALVVLAQTDAAGVTNIVASARTAPDGSYRLLAVPALTTGASYRLWFLNQPTTPPAAPELLGFWAGPQVSTLTAGQALTLPSFDVAGITLDAPDAYAEMVVTDAAPVVLRWSGRTTAGERQRACLYDPERADASTKLPVTYCGPPLDPSSDELAFTLRPDSLPANFGFTYGHSYRWYVEVYDGDPSNAEVQYGYSFSERALTLRNAPLPTPPTARTPETGEPTAGVANADWTLLIYVAADNALGDLERAPGLGFPAKQLTNLPGLAALYPTVNLVSYVDRYGPDGIELCAYPSGSAPDCRVRAEANTADPQTLADFIAYGRERYPATHTALLIVAPGQAAGQLALDETAPNAPAMSLAELAVAYQRANLGGTTKLDMVIYQAPLLGSVEVLQTTAAYARYMVASAGQVWQLGPYAALVPVLGGANRADVTAVVSATVSAYDTTAAAVSAGGAATWAAYDLERADALSQAVEALATSIETALAAESTVARPALATALAATQRYDASGNGRLNALGTGDGQVVLAEDASVDLRDLATQVQGVAGMPTAVQAAAATLATLLDAVAQTPITTSAIRWDKHNSQMNLGRARGVAIVFPNGDRFGGQATLAQNYHEADPPAGTRWAAMLWAYQASVLAVGPGGVTEGGDGGAQLRPLPGNFVGTRLYLYLPLVAR